MPPFTRRLPAANQPRPHAAVAARFTMTAEKLSVAFLAAFQHAAGTAGTLTFAEFMKLALYDSEVGYYRSKRRRIGYAAGTDFFTASTSGPVFGELVSAACIKLLGDRDPHAHTFVEIGAEAASSAEGTASAGVLAGVDHPFGSIRTISVGQAVELSGPCVVFSNELFDAQPFRRFRFRAGQWRELGVALHEGALGEIELPVSSLPLELPSDATEGYVIDAPLAAIALAKQIVAQPWTGVFVACDYGKSWRELIEATPAGTARAYFRHTQSNDLLARPGEQDLTCHVCWDWLSDVLAAEKFKAIAIETQEAFFIRHAEAYIAPAIAADAARFSPRKASLLQLLHPSHLGQKFQVLHALR
jgi:SAM-dependent MidA family methyltransferase